MKTWLGILNLNINLDVTLNKQKTSITLILEGCFNASAESLENEFIYMLNLNGVTALYSIARSIILSISAQTFHSGKITLPMFDVAAYSKDLNKINSELSTEENSNMLTEMQEKAEPQ